MQKNQPLMWRKGLVLSATFLFVLFLGISCKKKVNNIGQNNINQNEILASDGVDTFSLYTSTISDDIDSLTTSSAAYGILGSYNDPVFGPANGEIYTQLQLKVFNPSFFPQATDTITIDSVVLSLEYADYYGDVGSQNVQVYEITDHQGLNDTTDYYMSSSLSTSTKSLVESGTSNMNLNPSNPTVLYDTVEVDDPQLRIRLDTNFAWRIINESVNNPDAFTTHEKFNSFFKGFKIKTDNGFQAPGQGGLFYFDLNDTHSQLTVYYKLNNVNKEYPLVINSSCAKFNAMTIDHSMMDIETVIADSSEGQDQYYAQSFGSRAKILIPGLDNIPSNAIIHKATLTLPVSYQTGAKYAPAQDVAVTTFLESGGYSFYDFVGYDNTNKQYEIDLRAYAQAIVNNQVENTGLAISPVLYITSGDRTIFNGPNTINKAKPSLRIVYTEF